MPIDKSRLDLFIAPWQAARQLDLDMDSISQAINKGKLHAAVMTDGTIGISQQSVNDLLPREALPEYQENASLQGVPISINEGGRRYHLNTSTLTRWMQRGLIRTLGKSGNKTLLDEADVAYCARVYEQNKGQGKWTFDSEGRPYGK